MKVVDTTNLESAYKQWLDIQPLDETDRHRLSQRFTIDFNFNSNHIEGNTLTYGQTEILLLFGKVMGVADLKDFIDMKASNVGLKMMEVEALVQDKPLTQTFIRQLHHTLLREDYEVYRKLPGGEYTSYTVHAGVYKTRPNSVISRTGERFEYASPEETPALMTDLVDWYNEEERKGAMHPVELAALFHYRYIRIHPFEDGNGRIARLLVNYILARHHYPMVVVRSRKKTEYLDALSAADKEVGALPSKGAKATLIQIRHFLSYFTDLVTQEIISNVRFVTEKDKQNWWYDGEMIRLRSENVSQLLYAVMLNPAVTIPQLSAKCGLSERMVKNYLKQFMDKNYLQRGEDGKFHVFIAPSTL